MMLSQAVVAGMCGWQFETPLLLCCSHAAAAVLRADVAADTLLLLQCCQHAQHVLHHLLRVRLKGETQQQQQQQTMVECWQITCVLM
jgi:hypothetical protein